MCFDTLFGFLMKWESNLQTHIKTFASVKMAFWNNRIEHFEKQLIHNPARELNKQISLIQLFYAKVYLRIYCIILHESSYQCHFNTTMRVGDN